MAATKSFSGKRLRELREATGLSLEQTAVAIKRSWGACYMFERGTLTPGRQAQEALAELYDCRLDDFYVSDTRA